MIGILKLKKKVFFNRPSGSWNGSVIIFFHTKRHKEHLRGGHVQGQLLIIGQGIGIPKKSLVYSWSE